MLSNSILLQISLSDKGTTEYILCQDRNCDVLWLSMIGVVIGNQFMWKILYFIERPYILCAMFIIRNFSLFFSYFLYSLLNFKMNINDSIIKMDEKLRYSMTNGHGLLYYKFIGINMFLKSFSNFQQFKSSSVIWNIDIWVC